MARASKTAETSTGDQAEARESTKRSERSPELEAALGARIRALRVAAGMSQDALGVAVGISYQQVQKYELGKDRVSVSMLQGFAGALGVHPGMFFDDMPVPVRPRPEAKAKATLKATDVFAQIKDPRVLKRLLDLAKVLGGADDEQVEPPAVAVDGPR